MKDINHGYFLNESDFEIIFEKVEKPALENLIFERFVEKHTLSVLKGLKTFRKCVIQTRFLKCKKQDTLTSILTKSC